MEGPNYDDKIKDVAAKHPAIDTELFEILGHIKDMTSDHIACIGAKVGPGLAQNLQIRR